MFKNKSINYDFSKLLSLEDENSWFRKKFDDLRSINNNLRSELLKEINEKYSLQNEIGILKTKVDIYEKFINKMMEMDTDKSNSVFMINGELYRMVDYKLESPADPFEPKHLTANFDCTTPLTKNFSEPVEIGFKDTKEND